MKVQPSLIEKVAQLVFPRIGTNMKPLRTVDEDTASISALLDQYEIGGLCLFNGRWPETKKSIDKLQEKCKWPMLISTDMERGFGQPFLGATLFPHAMAYANQDVSKTEEAAYIAAREALAGGVQVSFSPVADVNLDPRNPIIATRAYGTDPVKTAKHVVAYIKGCQKAGLLTTAKHFPGHGNTAADSHAELPVVSSSREQLDKTDLVPFRAAIEAGVDMIMTAHIVYDGIDDSGKPATISPKILKDLLRDELGFEGVVISDSLLMAGIRDWFDSESHMAIELLQAGVDVLLDPADSGAVIEGIVAAVNAGTLDENVIDLAFNRIHKLKAKIAAGTPPSIEEISAKFDQHQAVANEHAISGLHVIKFDDHDLPWQQNGKTMTAVLLRPHAFHLDPPEQPLAAALRKAFPKINYFELGPDTPAEEYQKAFTSALSAGRLLVAMSVKPAAWQKFGLLDKQQTFLDDLTDKRSFTLASLGTLRALEGYEKMDNLLCTFSDVPPSQEALVHVISGR